MRPCPALASEGALDPLEWSTAPEGWKIERELQLDCFLGLH